MALHEPMEREEARFQGEGDQVSLTVPMSLFAQAEATSGAAHSVPQWWPSDSM